MKNIILTSMVGQEAAMRKVSKLFLLISLSFLLTFNSCNNVFENSVSAEENTSAQNNASQTDDKTGPAGNRPSSNPAATIVFGGSLAINGAVPAEFVEPEEATENQQNSRSANAELPGSTDYEYYVKATSNDGLVHEDIIPAASISKDYSLQLEINKTWTFTAGYRKKASGTPGTDSYVAPVNLLIDIDSDSGHPYSLTLSETVLEPATQKVFNLKPLQNGSGTIHLTMTVPSGIDNLKLFTSGENGVLIPWQTDALDVTKELIQTKTTIASGSYDVTMIFYSGEFQAYITYQTINVFDNMETKVWESGNAPGTESIISGGNFQLTTSLVQKFASSTIYVGAPEGVTVEPDDSRVGSPYAPVKTLNRAFEIIKANTSGDGNTRDYRILVTTAKPTAEKAAQPQKANLEIWDTITSTEAKSIEIVGIGSSPELRPAATNPGTVLTVNTTVPVKLSNIKITGGQGSGGKGGAISITQNDAKVTLESGTEISGNSASDQGGGIYIQGSDASHKPKLIIKAGAKIKSNSIGTSGTGGMAIFADCAEVEMTGGEISGNSKTGGDYGAVRLEKQSVFTMTGGTVSGNEGGAFYVGSSYESNTYKHSVLKLGGTAVITPVLESGKAQTRKNDVFIQHAYPEGQQDGGEYSPVEITSSGISSSGVVAALSPQDWQRGLDILAADNGDINNYKDYFMLTDSDFNFTKSGSQESIAKLKAPIYIKADGSDSPSASGTKNHPYKTLQYAAASLAGGEPDTILVIGKVSQQTVPSALISTKCSALTIKGVVDENDSTNTPEINANGANISALTFDTEVPVTIENLKITGGLGTEESSSTYGGGIYLKSGTLKLGDGVQVTGNRAKYGGGVYVKKDTKLFMYGSALIGDSLDTTATGETGCANYSSADGGGIYNAGSIYLGYKGIEEGNPVPETLTGGVKRNASYYGGGGIYNQGSSSSEKSNLKINSGNISYNKASCSAGISESPGGGIQNYQSNIEISGGEISYNEANSGGGVSVTANVSAVFSGGTVKENKAASWGGGITVSDSSNTSFIISGSASVPYGVTESGTLVKAPCKNDVHLASMYGSGDSISSYAVLKVGSNLTASGNVAAITLQHWRRGLQFLGVDGALTALDDTIIGKFDFTDKGWDKKKYTKTTTNDAAKIDADIYVAGSDPAKCKTSDGASAPTDTDNTIGNWAHPFASISAALSSGLLDASHDTIIVDGTVSGAQSISGTGSLSAVAIKGYKAAGATSSSAKIDAGGLTGAGSALTVNADGKTVTIQDLTITGGYSASNGGGINITAGTVKLVDGAKITGNIAAQYGGGVYLAGSNSKLFMSGSSLIGDSATSTTLAQNGTSASSTTFANKAVKSGGGIYNNGGAVYIGYSGITSGTPQKSDMTSGYGVRRNYAGDSNTTSGGGIQNRSGTLTIASGSISYNQHYNHGGGIYIADGEVIIEVPVNSSNAAKLEGNKAIVGGAIYNGKKLTMNAGQIGGSSATVQNTVEGTGAKGGAVYQGGTFTISGSAVVYEGSEKTNDVFLPSSDSYTHTISVGSLSGNGTVASITPKEYKRGINILSSSSALSDAVKARFSLTKDDAGWERKDNTASTTKYVYITSPIYVVDATDSGNTRPAGFNKGVTTDANGTKTSPYASVAAALAADDLALATEPNTITIAGTLKGAQTISSMSISELKLKGYKASDDTVSSAKIDAGGATGAGSALTVNKSGLTVTITDLTITGGSGSSMTVGGAAQTNGGGILLNAGTVKLSDGAVITGNAVANNGGGVYLSASGCALYMSGKALIGDSATSTTRASSAANNRANQAANGAGIYNNGGSVFIGSNTSGTAASGYSLVNDDTNGHYGVRRNYSTTSGAGAGIYHAGGTLKIASGDISNNNAGAAGAGTCNGGGVYCAADVDISGGTFKNNYAANGGGLYIATGKKATVNGAAVFTQNQSWVNGGAVYNAGEFTMSAGTIGGSNSSDANLAAGSAGLASYGGAIYQGGTFNVSGSAYVSSGTLKINDVYLPSNKKVTIDSTWSGSQASNKMTLTPSTWARGSQVLAGTKATDYYTYFNTSDSEWSVGYKESSWTLTDDLKTRIGADIYVAGSENRASGISAPSETASERIGTKLKPFNSIEEGVKACWTTTLPFTVKFSGTITGTAQTIPAGSTSTGGLASAITIEGVQGNSKDIINRNLSTATDSGTALTINTATPVTIKKIKITGGYNRNASGGGIRANVAGASLTLGEGALVTANNVTSSTTYDSGGGVYIEGTSTSPATFIMESDATISGNDSGQGSGGGVGLKYATLCMTGSALIGDKDATSAATGDSGKHSNSAQSGGGVYVGTGSKLRLGYATPTATTGTSLDAAYGIRYNYVYNAGGGVFVEAGSSVEIASGSISCNGTIANAQYKNGGGIYLNETATLTMTGGTIAKNKAYDGGGVYLYGNTSTGSSIVMSGGTIGDSSSGVTSAATGSDEKFSNYAAHDGGGIYAATAKNTVTLNGGNVSYNYSARQGGGIYTKTDTAFKANAKYNGAGGSGGGIYSTGGTTLTMTAGTIYGNKASATADTDEGRLWCGGGGVWFEGTFKMSGGTIQGNSATWYGGGVGTGDGIFYMSGSAVIGDKSKTAVPDASETTSPTANRAQYGGGFAATNDPDIYLGYSGKTGSTLNASSLASGGICYNYASKHGGGYYQKSGGRPLIMATGNIDYNKAADSASQGGGIYTEAGLQMTGCTITGNAASNGGAILLKKCVYKVAGNIYIPYDSASGSANRENTVQMMGTESKITVTGSLTNTNSTVMTVEPHTWAIGTLVADKDTSLSSENFKTSVAKIGIVKNNIYSKVELIGGTYNNSSTVSKAVVGIDFSTVTQSNILSYMSGKTWSLSSAEPYPSNELNYFFLCDKTSPNSRYAILKVIHYNSMDCGKFIASSVLIGSTNQESNLTTVDYDTSTSEIREYATWNPFKVTSPTYADYIVVYKQDHSIGMQLGSNYLGWYKVQ